MSGPVRPVDGGVEILVWVVPGAQRSEIVGLHGDRLRVRIAQPAEGGRANDALVDMIGGILDAGTELVSGHRSRQKRLFVAGIAVSNARQLLDV